MTVALALLLGALIGVLLGLLGGGGSILAVPALVFALGLPLEQAIPVSLIVIGIASAVEAMPKMRAGQVQWRLAAVFAAAGIPATFLGTALGKHLPQPVLLSGFAVVMVSTGAGAHPAPSPPDWPSACSPDCSGSAVGSSSSPRW